jgi:hypothetical protein
MVRKDIIILPTIGPTWSLPDGHAWAKINRIWAMSGIREEFGQQRPAKRGELVGTCA